MNNYFSPSTNQVYQCSDGIDYLVNGGVPADCVLVQDAQVPALVAALQAGQSITVLSGVATVQPMPAAQQIALNEVAIQGALDAMAQTRGYADIKSACAYAAPAPVVPATNPNFAQCEKYRIEGNALQIWMTETWAEAYNYVATVKAGTNPMPTAVQAVTLMPVFTWPD